ncbi:putative inorganic phosphate cotransporter [Dermacentor silvarum]|uniref:putative inorganic phosphate cotransporter n=1 Tax=Dermacentor silvarum TaxID=543639 RepID=UPI002100ECD6|nr:putative inorganic phosphate cotransporter [Dermacentor silvarum]
MGSGILVSSLLTLLTPAAARLHYTALMLVRFLMGVAGSCCFPAMQAMLAQWVPKAERTIISNIVFTGSFTGTVVAMTSTGVMSDSEVLGGWPSAFYLFGFTGCAWCLMWFLMIHNRPVEHPRISHGELMFITGGSMMPIPWKAMLTSPAVWSLAATQWAHTYGSYTLMTELPNYLKNILGFGLTQNGILNGAPYLALSVLSLIIGWTSDVVRRRNVATVTTIRKICDSVSAFGPALCLIAVTMAPCERMLAVLWFWMAISLISFANSGFNCTHIDMAPAFAEQCGELEDGVLHHGRCIRRGRPTVPAFRVGRATGVGHGRAYHQRGPVPGAAEPLPAVLQLVHVLRRRQQRAGRDGVQLERQPGLVHREEQPMTTECRRFAHAVPSRFVCACVGGERALKYSTGRAFRALVPGLFVGPFFFLFISPHCYSQREPVTCCVAEVWGPEGDGFSEEYTTLYSSF